MRDAFSTVHPGMLLAYFAVVIGMSMFVMHPVFLGISLLASIAYALYVGRGAALRFIAAAALPMIVLFSLVNPLLNHAGATVLAVVFGLPFTLEALAYGCVAGMMFVSVIMWFYCANRVMTADAVLYLLGRAAPSLALLVAMVIRLVPRLGRQARAIMRAQRGIGCDPGEGPLLARARRGLTVISILASWALESSIDTADSMRSRGYGLSGRTSYMAYRFTGRDAVLAAAAALAAAVSLLGVSAGAGAASYFPLLDIAHLGSGSLAACIAWAVMCLLPLIVDGWEELAWMRSTSRA